VIFNWVAAYLTRAIPIYPVKFFEKDSGVYPACPVEPGLPRAIRFRQRSAFLWGTLRVFNRGRSGRSYWGVFNRDELNYLTNIDQAKTKT